MAFAQLGYQIGIFDILSKKEGNKVIREIEKFGMKGVYVQVDVSSEEGVEKGASIVKENLGTPTVLVNNAGVFPRNYALDMSYTEFKKVIDINLNGTFLCSKTFAPDMIKKGEGNIINISSVSGLQGEVRGSHYAASKAGIISLTRSLALEWAPKIRVNSILPGLTDTDQPRDDNTLSGDDLYNIGKETPLGRIGTPEDIAKAACLFIDPNSSYITGQSLCVNGGAVMQ